MSKYTDTKFEMQVTRDERTTKITKYANSDTVTLSHGNQYSPTSLMFTCREDIVQLKFLVDQLLQATK